MSRFNEFWSLYPRKIARRVAEKSWAKNECDDIADKVIEGLKKQLPHWTEAKFIPHPATWLNAGRWDDVAHVDVRHGPARPIPPPFVPPPQTDGWKANLNRVLVDLLRENHGVSDDVMARLLRGRDHYAAQFREMWGECAKPDDDFLGIMQNVVANFRRVIKGQA